jgi:hypothetical protein
MYLYVSGIDFDSVLRQTRLYFGTVPKVVPFCYIWLTFIYTLQYDQEISV